MKIALYGKNTYFFEKILRKKGVEIVDRDSPGKDLMICYGGDGALLGAELFYPGLPKMPIRDVETAPHCPKHSLERQIDLLLSGSLTTTLLPKLSGKACGQEFFALNDIFIHNKNSFCALRYQVKIDEELYADEIVGDGVSIATVHGSTGYYKSITHGSFRTGIGLAFSNSTDMTNHLVLSERSVIKVRILRGPAEMAFDNSEETVILQDGEVAVVRQSDKVSMVLGLELFMCPECRRIRREQRKSGFENSPF
ncbi:MAG: NAD(+)/NADH kinase [Lentisphaeria bacterium]|nr:NAD(+)/NADH kinase [Lentisphaeria bacterium]